MIVSLTGTPGTGKTSISQEFDEFKVIDLTNFVKKHGLGVKGEKEFEVDIEAMKDKLEKEIDPEEDTLIEGHLSHHYPSDYCVVLRCGPEELRERLSERDYSEEKIEENIQAEILDSILIEAAETQDKIIEIDTTNKKAEENVDLVKEKIEKGENSYGQIDWSDFIT